MTNQCNNTPFVKNTAYAQVIAVCKEFMDNDKNNVDGRNFYLKGTFLENKNGYRSIPIKNLAELETKLQATRNPSKALQKPVPTCDVFSHLLLQPRVDNHEEKIVLINGVAIYSAKSDSTSGLSKRVSKSELYSYAEAVVVKLKAVFPHFLCDGLIRVDIFRTKAGKLVVNEVESLDASLHTTRERYTIMLFQFYRKYWRFIIRDCIKMARLFRDDGFIDYDEGMTEFVYHPDDAKSITS